ncbi:hypothetical protein [Siccibacter turicensis]|uniref:hypothetical protein n=1 Tax=Siccibacter turicensis TaxID=357233 RepID=UPI0023F16777|nr:hypothetical protein [Siccibacter turicensis]
MTVTHNGKEYAVTPLASGYHWQLVEVGAPRNKLTLNREQMVIAGFINDADVIDINQVKAAQSKAAIAQFTGNETMWMQAAEQFRAATGRYLH